MKFKTILWAALLFACIGACNTVANHKEMASLKREVDIAAISDNKQEERQQQLMTDSAIQQSPDKQDEPEKKKQSPMQPIIPKPDLDKKIIKTATINLEVKDYNSFYSSLREKIRNHGGYVAQEEQQQTDYKIENTIVIKVLVDQFDNALMQLSSGVKKINERKITSQDVTSEFIDTKSRIGAKKQVRERYIELLKQAKNMEEILNVQSEINGIQEEIESATGRVEYLGHSAAYSTINATIYQVLNASAKDEGSSSFGAKLGTAFKAGWFFVRDLVVRLVALWPLFLLLLCGFLLYKQYRPLKTKQAE